MRIVTVALVAALGASPANAQGQRAECWDIEPGTGKTFFNAAMTDRVRNVEANADVSLMRSFSGTWVGETVYPDRSMVDRTWYTFDSNGLFQYQSETCGQVISQCSRGYGQGGWAARALPNGQIEVVFGYNDLQRSAACGALVGRVEGATMNVNGGFVLQRVQ